MEDKRIPRVDDRMTRIRSTLIPYDHIGILGEDVDDLSFSFIAPLATDDDEIRHGSLPTLLCLQKSKKKP
jgi:hypothetical protein